MPGHDSVGHRLLTFVAPRRCLLSSKLHPCEESDALHRAGEQPSIGLFQWPSNRLGVPAAKRCRSWGNVLPLSPIFRQPFRSSVSSARPLPCLIVRTLFSTHDTRSRAERIIRTLRGIASCAFYSHERWDRLLREGVGGFESSSDHSLPRSRVGSLVVSRRLR